MRSPITSGIRKMPVLSETKEKTCDRKKQYIAFEMWMKIIYYAIFLIQDELPPKLKTSFYPKSMIFVTFSYHAAAEESEKGFHKANRKVLYRV